MDEIDNDAEAQRQWEAEHEARHRYSNRVRCGSSPLPFFAEYAYFLWGEVNYDSEGDCDFPTDRAWKDLSVENRSSGAVVFVECEEPEGGSESLVSVEAPSQVRTEPSTTAPSDSSSVIYGVSGSELEDVGRAAYLTALRTSGAIEIKDGNSDRTLWLTPEQYVERQQDASLNGATESASGTSQSASNDTTVTPQEFLEHLPDADEVHAMFLDPSLAEFNNRNWWAGWKWCRETASEFGMGPRLIMWSVQQRLQGKEVDSDFVEWLTEYWNEPVPAWHHEGVRYALKVLTGNAPIGSPVQQEQAQEPKLNDEDDELHWQDADGNETIRQFRYLCESYSRYRGSAVVEDVLEPWRSAIIQSLDWLKTIGYSDKWNATSEPDFDVLNRLYQWYAFGKFNDYLLKSFESSSDFYQGNSARETWKGPIITPAEYGRFFTSLGFSLFADSPDFADGQRPCFHPFYHEVVEVVEDRTHRGTAVVEHAFWPGLMFGQMMFSRAGVRVRCRPRGEIRKKIAETSILYFTPWRLRRTAEDLSHGWGSNSRWSTAFRRDYVTDDAFLFNVDGEHPLGDPEAYRASFSPTSWESAQESKFLPSMDQRIELLVNRCLVRSRLPKSADIWPYDDSFILPKDANWFA